MKTTYKLTIFFVLLTFIGWSNIKNAQNIAAGGWHSLAVCNDGTVKGFGENASGQLGDGTTVDRNTPVSVTGLTSIISVSGGGDQLEAHSLALKSDGIVWSWGSNIYGGLGNGTTTNSLTPVQVLVLTGVSKISAGGWHSVALKDDGTVWTWGWNSDGQLGIGTLVDKNVPVQVNGLTGVIAISAGTYHTLALKSDGTVWAWGDNISGQIGDGTTTDRTTPVQVTGLTGVTCIAAGRFFSLAVKSDGTVWTWGENLYGQLGNGTTTDSHVPIQVSGLTGITSATVATGAFHCMAVKNDGTIWAWGRNTYGNLGDGTVINRFTPVQMLDISNATILAAGTNFSLLVKGDGSFWGCGRNASGQLGDGTNLQRNTVVQATTLCPVKQPSGITTPNISDLFKIEAFPNPSPNGKFTIKLDDGRALVTDYKIEIYNIIGEKVYQSVQNPQLLINKTMSIDLSEQVNGIYIMTLTTAEYKLCHKLVKQ
jgi:alpha-tubulin suppressor-like RCC1 family protein